jgi:hypothetical protein
MAKCKENDNQVAELQLETAQLKSVHEGALALKKHIDE